MTGVQTVLPNPTRPSIRSPGLGVDAGLAPISIGLLRSIWPALHSLTPRVLVAVETAGNRLQSPACVPVVGRVVPPPAQFHMLVLLAGPSPH
jgi:hypothetical protein